MLLHARGRLSELPGARARAENSDRLDRRQPHAEFVSIQALDFWAEIDGRQQFDCGPVR